MNTQNIIALVYDFDGTLTKQPMQEYTVLPEMGVQAEKFWKEVKQESKHEKADEILTYMRLLIKKMDEKELHVDKKILKKMAKNIKLYPGVETWFDRIDNYVKSKTKGKVKIEHYLISAGLKEILDGINIKKKIKCIYASEYYYDHHKAARFPNIVINDTVKTQFLFRINKGVLDINNSINEHMPEKDRRIPFDNIIYIGDGLTDVPCMTLTKKSGGHSVAVYAPNTSKGKKTAQKLLKAERVDYACPADYTKYKKLEKRIKLILDKVVANILYQKEVETCVKEMRK